MGHVDIFGMSLGGMVVVAIIWAIIWFGLLGMDSETLPVPLGLGVLTYWLLGKGIPSMWASFTIMVSEIFSSVSGVFSGFDNSILSYVEIAGYIVLWILAILAIGVIVWLAFRGKGTDPPKPPVQPPTTVAPPVQPPPQPPPFVSVSTYLNNTYALGPNELYHGTSVEAARDIFTEHRWKSGMQGRIFMTNQFEYAADMAQRRDVAGSGEIVVVHYHPLLQLDYGGGGAYTFDIMRYFGSWEPDEYYIIEGLTPIHILDIHGRIIA